MKRDSIIRLTVIGVLFATILMIRAIQTTDKDSSRLNDLVIPARLLPRTDLQPLGNVHGFANVCDADSCGDFHIAAYFVHPNEFRVIIRRLDQLTWTYNVSIFVQSAGPPRPHYPTYLREVFTIGPSNQTSVHFTFPSTIDLVPDHSVHQEQRIPKTIIQTFFTRMFHSTYQVHAHQTFVELNPEYTIKMFSDRDARHFLRLRFTPAILEAYDVLLAPSFKADLFRYAYLALRGGCYFDHKMILRQPLRRIIKPQDDLLVCSDAVPLTGKAPVSLADTKRLYNAVICSQKNDFRMWRTLNAVVTNILLRHKNGSDLSLTGPLAFYRAIEHNITEEHVRFKHGFRMRSVLGASRKYEDYFIREKLTDGLFLTKFYHGFQSDPFSRYGDLWRMGLVYYEALGRVGGWKLYAYPGQSACVSVGQDPRSGMLSLRSAYRTANNNNNNSVSTPSMAFDAKCQRLKLHAVHDDSSDSFQLDLPYDPADPHSDYPLPPFIYTK